MRPCARPLRRRLRRRHRPDRQGARAQSKSRGRVVPRRIPEAVERRSGRRHGVLRARDALEPARPRDVSDPGGNGDGASVCRAFRYGVVNGGDGLPASAELPDAGRRHGGEPCAGGPSGQGRARHDSLAPARSHVAPLQSRGLARHPPTEGSRDPRRWPAKGRAPAMTEQSRETIEQGNRPDADPAPSQQAPPASEAVSPEKQKANRRRKMLLGGAGAVVLAAVLAVGVPWAVEALNTVSTDDAYVNGHVTFVAARVRGQVARVVVDDNNRVHRGDLLVELDKEPYQTAVAVKRAAVDTAKADLQMATAAVRGIEAEARSRRWKLQHAMEDVAHQIAELHTRVAGVDKSKAALNLAELEFERARQLVASNNIPRSEFDRRQATLVTARAELVQALADVNQIRVSLGLKTLPLESPDLGKVPSDLDQTFSAVREAQAALIQSAAQLGVIHSYNQTPQEMLDEFEKSGSGDIDRTLARLAADAPAVKQAEARLEAAKRDLAQAELDLRYCDIAAEIDGVVTRRNVNPGNNVQVGQALMALRSLDEIWVDANFKETQLSDLRIGQPVDLNVDMYGGRQTFKGRIAGFTMGTGSTLALLPAQNATGNFVKVVQRLPVRIELVGYDADKNPLFIGTSVVPVVHIHEPPTGPDAGKFLQARALNRPAAASASAAGSGK